MFWVGSSRAAVRNFGLGAACFAALSTGCADGAGGPSTDYDPSLNGGYSSGAATAGTGVGTTGSGGTGVGTTGLGTTGTTGLGTTGTTGLGTTGTTGLGTTGTTGLGTTGTTGLGTTGTTGLGTTGTTGLGTTGTTGLGTTGTTGLGTTGTTGLGTTGTTGLGTTGTTGLGGTTGGTSSGTSGSGSCCADCICRGSPPPALTSEKGPFGTANYRVATGQVFHPTNAEAPFSGVALCGGFLNTGPEMNAWGDFYASHGIVTLITTTGALDFPDVRARKLIAAIETLKQENNNPLSPLSGKMSGRYGTSGYSMGGGGTTLATQSQPTLKSSVGLAAWGATGQRVQVPTLFLCGDADVVAPCSISQGAYGEMPNSTPKMGVIIAGASHLLSWFGPRDGGGGMSGGYALAFQKVFLEGDERWKPTLLSGGGEKATNIQ